MKIMYHFRNNITTSLSLKELSNWRNFVKVNRIRLSLTLHLSLSTHTALSIDTIESRDWDIYCCGFRTRHVSSAEMLEVLILTLVCSCGRTVCGGGGKVIPKFTTMAAVKRKPNYAWHTRALDRNMPPKLASQFLSLRCIYPDSVIGHGSEILATTVDVNRRLLDAGN